MTPSFLPNNMDEQNKKSIIPNTTQVPNFVLDELLPNLSDVELRIVLIVTRQTLGWVEDKETGRRKDRDWISRYQLQKKTGKSGYRISKAIDSLIKGRVIEAYSEKGEPLDTTDKRAKIGGKIYYRLQTQQQSLFSRQSRPRTKSAGVGSFKETPQKFLHPAQKVPPTNSAPTKETYSTKDNAKASELDFNKKKLPTNSLIGAFSHYSKAIRGVKPEFARFKDGNLIKCALKHLTEGQVEMLFLWFLKEKTNMRPVIGAALCKEVIADFIDTSHREYGFYAKLDGLWRQHARRRDESQTATTDTKEMVEKLIALKTQLASKLTIPLNHSERTAMQEGIAREERAARV